MIAPSVLRVTVVDDEPGMCLGARRVLDGMRVRLEDIGEEYSLIVSTHGSAEEFLEAAVSQEPDILLLDCKLPGMDGMEVLELLKRDRPQLLTVMITAYATLETAIRATRLGAYDFLAKPFTPDELRVTVQKAARNVLLTRKARALESERRKVRFEFLSVLAHELKSPLNAVEGYLDILKSRGAGEELAAYDEMITRSLVRIDGMRKLILDLLDLTRIESGARARTLGPVDIAQAVAASAAMFEPQAAERGISIKVSGGPVSMAKADRTEIEMLLNNLISNAIKYNRDNGSVDVRLARSGDSVRIEVADTGIGLTREEQQRLFSEFGRIRNDHTRHIAGSGLGLSIVKKLAILYGGGVSVESVEGAGSTFTVTLGDKPDAEV